MAKINRGDHPAGRTFDGRREAGAGAEPGPPAPRARYYLTLTVASTALWTGIVGPLLVLLPEQAQVLAGDDKIVVYTLIATVGGVLGVAINPLIGRLSDRTRSRFGRRRPWIAGGALASAAVLVFLGQTPGITGLLIGWSVFQVFANMVFTGLSATIPDQVPEARRGAASACLGVSWAVAPVLGTGLAAATGNRPAPTYGILALVMVAACAVFVLMIKDPPAPEAASRDTDHRLSGAYRIDHRTNPDFTFAWLTRFCVALGQNMAVAFLFFFLQDVVRYAEHHPGGTTEDAMATVTLIYAVGVVAASVADGRASDRFARRKIFVTAATVVFALGTGLGAFYPTWPGVLALGVLTGIGFGVYEATDMALVTEVLPSDADRAKDLSLINMATTLGITFGPIVGAVALEAGGYVTLYLASGLVVLLGAAFVRPIRSVR